MNLHIELKMKWLYASVTGKVKELYASNKKPRCK